MPAPSASTPFFPNLNQQVVLDPQLGPSLLAPLLPAAVPRNGQLNLGETETDLLEGEEEEEGTGLREKLGWRIDGIDNAIVWGFS